jgi:flagellar protein FliS
MPVESNPANAYLRTKVLTASPEELRLLLLDGAIKFARQGSEGLASKNYEASYNGIIQCRNIVLELLTTIRPEFDPEMCERVKAVYAFMYTELVSAGMERNVTKLDAVVKLLEYERETWVMLMDKLAAERAAGDTAPAPAAAPSAGPPAANARTAISVQG